MGWTYIAAINWEGDLVRMLLHIVAETDHRGVYTLAIRRTVKALGTRVLSHLGAPFDYELDKIFVFVQVEDINEENDDQEVWHHSAIDTGWSATDCAWILTCYSPPFERDPAWLLVRYSTCCSRSCACESEHTLHQPSSQR